jgi:Tfp pilus assembly protein PilN
MIYFGTSIGIAVRGDDLEIVCARGRWNRVAVTGFLRIENFLSRPQVEVAELYRRFRKENHAATTSATVALPRGAGLIRLLDMPAEVAPNLAQAVEYQVDLLHPFEEGSMAWDWAVLSERGAPASGQAAEGAGQDPPAGLSVAVALVEKQAIGKLADWFSAVGIDVACFTFAGAVMYRALVAATVPARSGFAGRPLILLDGQGTTVEMLGIASDGRFCSREVPASAPLEKEVALCAAELRIAEGAYDVAFAGRFGGEPPESHPTTPFAPGGEPVARRRLEELSRACLPQVRPPRPGRQEFRLGEAFAAYAAALAGLEPRVPGLTSQRGLRWNLLPRERRVYRSHWAYTAAWILAVLALLLGAARVTTGWVQDRYYSAWLDSQIGALAPRVQYLERLDSQQKNLLAKIETLEREQRNVARRMEAWRELTRLLPNTVWLQSMSFTENQVAVAGQAESAAGLLQLIGQSPYFEQPEFVSAVGKNSEGRETFQIRIRLRETPLVSAAPAALPLAVGAPPGPAAEGAAPPSAPPANGRREGK